MTIKEQKRLVKEVIMIHKQKLDILKQSIAGNTFSAPLNGPLPKLQSLPLEDPKIYGMINSNIDLIDELKDVFKQRL